MLFLGIDGGGTETVAAVCDENGKIISSARGKSINFRSVGYEKAKKNLLDTITSLGVGYEFDSAVIGLSAIEERMSESEALEFTKGVLNSRFLLVDSDLFIASESVCSDGSFAVAVAGTGSMAIFCNNGEITGKAGGWGHILGDEGSAYSIAIRGIKSAIAFSENRGEKTSLLSAVADYFGINELHGIIGKIYNENPEKSFVASFAKRIYEEALAGDKVSLGILKDEARSFAETVTSQINNKDTIIYCSGSVLLRNEIYRKAFDEAVTEAGFSSPLNLPRCACIGALAAAFELCSEQIPDSLKNSEVLI